MDICTDSFYIVNSGLPCIPVTAVYHNDDETRPAPTVTEGGERCERSGQHVVSSTTCWKGTYSHLFSHLFSLSPNPHTVISCQL